MANLCIFMDRAAAQALTPDSANQVVEISIADFMQGVLAYHPVARQIELLTPQAQASLRAARGGFDPSLYGTYDDKYFKKTNYWRIFEGGLSVPTQLGLELKAGYYFQDGDFVNAERSIPDEGQLLLGAKLPLGQGLFIDKRRAELQKAKIFIQSNQLEQQLQFNDLVLDAALAYWDWAWSYAYSQRLTEAALAAQERFDGIKSTFEAGDAAGIDTVEAFTQLQQIRIAYNEALLELEMRRLELSNFLWTSDMEPIQLSAAFIPSEILNLLPESGISLEELEMMVKSLVEHPQIRQIGFKLASLEVERRFKADKLKPKIDVNYNLLSNSVNGEGVSAPYSLNTDNYKWGVSLNFPLFLRKERGELALTRVKIQETALYQDNKMWELRNKVLNYAEQFQTYLRQMDRINLQVQNYEQLYQGEIQKFLAGESTLFLVNSRQQKLIDAQQKQLEIAFKLRKARLSLDWVRAILYNPT